MRQLFKIIQVSLKTLSKYWTGYAFLGGVLVACGLAYLAFHAEPRRALASSDPTLDAYISNPPERYAPLAQEVREILGKSILSRSLVSPDSREFQGATLWEFLDRALPSSGLQTLVQVHQAAKAAGLWPEVERLNSIYAGTSWGIEFDGPTAPLRNRLTASDFCHDIDRVVRREHGNTEHSWWRHLSRFNEVGSLHVGISEGAPHNNYHFDSTNPAESRGFLGNEEMCRYSIPAVIEHNADIRLGVGTGAVDEFIRVEQLNYYYKRVSESLRQDITFSPPGSTRTWAAILARIETVEWHRQNVVDEMTRLSALPDGYRRARSSDFIARRGAYEYPLLTVIREFADQIRQEGAALHYLNAGSVFESLPFAPRKKPNPGQKDFETLSAFSEQLSAPTGLQRIRPNQMDAIIAIFERIRKKSKSN